MLLQSTASPPVALKERPESELLRRVIVTSHSLCNEMEFEFFTSAFLALFKTLFELKNLWKHC